VGIIQAFQHEVPEPNAAQVAMQHIAATRAAAWFFAKTPVLRRKGLLRLSRGPVTLPRIVAELLVVTITATGARTGWHHATPLLSVPVGDDIAVVGTSFGHSSLPAGLLHSP
jgi:hypothetical protein